MIVFILLSNAKTLLDHFAIRTVSTFVYIKRLSCSSNVNIVEWLVSTLAVRLFLGSALNISLGLAYRAGVTNVVPAGTRSPTRTK